MKAIIYKDELGKDVSIEDIPADLADEAAAAREHLLEEVSHYDDELVELILEEQEIPTDRLVTAIRKATLDIKIDAGPVRLLLQEQGRAAAARRGDRLPALAARRAARQGHEPVKGEDEDREAVRNASDDEPFAALAFKIMADPYVGKLTYFRVYSGKLEAGSRVLNVDHRPYRADRAHPDDARQRPRGRPGDLRRRHRGGRRHQAGRDRRHARRA